MAGGVDYMMSSASDKLWNFAWAMFFCKSHFDTYKIQSFSQWAEEIAVKKGDMVPVLRETILPEGDIDKWMTKVISDGECCEEHKSSGLG